ncbi:hypothetical protein EDEG_02025 [Edhazardia aedis USNM 41457]|uniref:Uncharacterized protein n=1 Tax=Edhazardia aedis (strain USNM 41457) TaxID=1003232 RepID=J9D823_EDHAE|nr:hypothetical protein EDEG_02025 [Edhazardia aedis USNM 41457]|eukprot:EJW03654.1 hypothetical protein EDEG_02025 [Edhazardia aedis USNM 41457]
MYVRVYSTYSSRLSTQTHLYFNLLFIFLSMSLKELFCSFALIFQTKRAALASKIKIYKRYHCKKNPFLLQKKRNLYVKNSKTKVFYGRIPATTLSFILRKHFFPFSNLFTQ